MEWEDLRSNRHQRGLEQRCDGRPQGFALGGRDPSFRNGLERCCLRQRSLNGHFRAFGLEETTVLDK